MILKSYLVEEDFNKIKNNIVLFYGENFGLQNDFKYTINKIFNKNKILNFDQEQIIKSSSLLYKELKNQSLFEDKTIIIINNINDKILDIIKDIFETTKDKQIYLFSGILEKKSKIRNFFEKKDLLDIVPCYKDSLLSLKTIILKELKNYRGLTPDVINYISENASLDRIKLRNELDKIKTYFLNSIINFEKLEKLLNLKEDDDFNNIKNSAIGGNLKKTNNLLSSYILDAEKLFFHISLINHRLLQLFELDLEDNNLEKSIDKIKPPIFWKDKPSFFAQAKLWRKDKLIKALKMTYISEIRLKSSYDINKKVLFKKLIVDICNLANAA